MAESDSSALCEDPSEGSAKVLRLRWAWGVLEDSNLRARSGKNPHTPAAPKGTHTVAVLVVWGNLGWTWWGHIPWTEGPADDEVMVVVQKML